MISALLLSMALFQAAPEAAAQEAAWTVLNRALDDGSASRRLEGLAALSTIGEPDSKAVQRAEAALKDRDALVRQSAALTLGELNASDAVPALKQALEDTPEVAFAAAKSLTKLGDPSGRDLLVAVLAGERKDTPGMMTSAVRKAKDKLHHPEALALTGAKDATGAMFGPVSMAIPAVQDAVEMRSKGSPGRAAAAAWLARDPDAYSVTLLEWALNDDSELVRLQAATGLGQRGNAESIPKLRGMFNDSHPLVRDMAAAAVIQISDRNGQPGAASTCAPAAGPATHN